jgi:hypothetical protein
MLGSKYLAFAKDVKFSERAQEITYSAAKTKSHSITEALTLPTFNATIKTIFWIESDQEVKEFSVGQYHEQMD